MSTRTNHSQGKDGKETKQESHSVWALTVYAKTIFLSVNARKEDFFSIVFGCCCKLKLKYLLNS